MLTGRISVFGPVLANFIVCTRARRASIGLAAACAECSPAFLVPTLTAWSLTWRSVLDFSIPSEILCASFMLLSESDTVAALLFTELVLSLVILTSINRLAKLACCYWCWSLMCVNRFYGKNVCAVVWGFKLLFKSVNVC